MLLFDERKKLQPLTILTYNRRRYKMSIDEQTYIGCV
jgi:hypothetical protein